MTPPRGGGDRSTASTVCILSEEIWGQIYVPPVTIEKAMEGLDLVDLIDADIQGAEVELLDWIELLTSKCA